MLIGVIVLSVIFFINALIAINDRKDSLVSQYSTASVLMGMIAMGLQFLVIFLARVALDSGLEAGDVLKPSVWAWLVMIVGVVHIAFLAPRASYSAEFNSTEADEQAFFNGFRK